MRYSSRASCILAKVWFRWSRDGLSDLAKLPYWSLIVEGREVGFALLTCFLWASASSWKKFNSSFWSVWILPSSWSVSSLALSFDESNAIMLSLSRLLPNADITYTLLSGFASMSSYAENWISDTGFTCLWSVTGEYSSELSSALLSSLLDSDSLILSMF